MRTLTAAALLAVSALFATLLGAAPAQAAGGIQIYRVYYDSPGSDNGSNSSLNAEYVQLKNTSSQTKYLTGWTLRDAANHVYKFPTTKIGAGKTLYVRTGKGTNDWNDRFWGKTWYVWNNTGDTARFQTPAGKTFDTCTYKAVTGRYRVAC